MHIEKTITPRVKSIPQSNILSNHPLTYISDPTFIIMNLKPIPIHHALTISNRYLSLPRFCCVCFCFMMFFCLPYTSGYYLILKIYKAYCIIIS